MRIDVRGNGGIFAPWGPMCTISSILTNEWSILAGAQGALDDIFSMLFEWTGCDRGHRLGVRPWMLAVAEVLEKQWPEDWRSVHREEAVLLYAHGDASSSSGSEESSTQCARKADRKRPVAVTRLLPRIPVTPPWITRDDAGMRLWVRMPRDDCAVGDVDVDGPRMRMWSERRGERVQGG